MVLSLQVYKQRENKFRSEIYYVIFAVRYTYKGLIIFIRSYIGQTFELKKEKKRVKEIIN